MRGVVTRPSKTSQGGRSGSSQTDGICQHRDKPFLSANEPWTRNRSGNGNELANMTRSGARVRLNSHPHPVPTGGRLSSSTWDTLKKQVSHK